MKIISLQAENVKKLVAIEITPKGNLVEICGKNGQGKTSVLDSIWWALAGTKSIQAAPIRKGATQARIRLDLGEIIVTRKFSKGKDGSDESSIAVENAEGARYPSPQKMLDALLGELSFDPLAFARMDAKDRFNALKRFVPGVDFEALANADAGDRSRRTEVNRLAKQERSAALVITVPDGTPIEAIDETALVDELTKAGETNADRERRSANRLKAIDQIATLMATFAGMHDRIAKFAEERMERCGADCLALLEEIDRLKARIETIKVTAGQEICANREQLAVEGLNAQTLAQELQSKLDAAGELPAIVDTAAITARINKARTDNANVRKLEDRNKHVAAAKVLEEQSDALTNKIEARQAGTEAAIAAAKMPVEGIDFGDGDVLLRGVPFDQASDAEQLRASIAIAMALNPKLRVIRVRDGSLLDEDSMQILGEMCDKQDFQCWIEVVDSSGKVGFVLENGHVRQAVQAEDAVSA